MDITIFTPTFNRIDTLPRVYNSLLAQTDKDFLWLIIDDGSSDNTKSLVESWIKENKLIIEYHFKENGGKHTAMKLSYELAKTKYLIAIDSDDELTPDAVEVFRKEWNKIEQDGMEDQFAEVSGLTYSTNAELIGDFNFPKSTDHIDSNWHEMVLKFRNNNEHIVCWNLDKLKECVQIPERFWLSEKVNFIGESVFWARIGRKYKTRYINKKLRIYHFDGGGSLDRITDKTKALYNNLVSHKYFLEDNLDYFFWNPKYFFNLIIKFIIAGNELKITPISILNNIKTIRFKLVYLLFYPTGLVAWFYFKYIKRKFWF